MPTFCTSWGCGTRCSRVSLPAGGVYLQVWQDSVPKLGDKSWGAWGMQGCFSYRHNAFHIVKLTKCWAAFTATSIGDIVQKSGIYVLPKRLSLLSSTEQNCENKSRDSEALPKWRECPRQIRTISQEAPQGATSSQSSAGGEGLQGLAGRLAPAWRVRPGREWLGGFRGSCRAPHLQHAAPI